MQVLVCAVSVAMVLLVMVQVRAVAHLSSQLSSADRLVQLYCTDKLVPMPVCLHPMRCGGLIAGYRVGLRQKSVSMQVGRSPRCYRGNDAEILIVRIAFPRASRVENMDECPRLSGLAPRRVHPSVALYTESGGSMFSYLFLAQPCTMQYR